MYKITIEKITKTEYPERNYKNVDKETGKEVFYSDDGYESSVKETFETGKILIKTDTETVYTQTSEKEIDIKKVIDSFNQ